MLVAVMTLLCLPVSGMDKAKAAESLGRKVLDFDTGWLYSNIDYENGEIVDLDDSGFEKVSVPHANTFVKDHVADDFENDIASYRFVSWYRRHFTLPEEYAGRNIRIEFEGVATIAEVYLNGEFVGEHEGAYTGFTVDITDAVYTDGRDNVLAVRVDSQRQPQLPPEGGNVDYCLFGGIVRDVNMTITDPVYVARTFVTTPDLEKNSGTSTGVKTQADIQNTLTEDKTYTIETTVKDQEGVTVATASRKETLPAGKEATVTVETEAIRQPHLWDVDDPYLYTLVTTIKDGTTVIDTYDTTFGMRYFRFNDDAEDKNFYLNGRKLEIIGINRHEQWPWIGRAVPDKLQRQDADLIKATGMNAVRCSHYPQDPSFMERCDEIGLLVFTEPPGWQHVGDATWQANFKTNLEELILRDRNHPSVISWGVVPNESEAQTDEVKLFNQDCNKLAKELDPTRPTHGVRWEFFFDNHMVDGKLQDIVTDLLTANYRYPGMQNGRDDQLLSTFDLPYLVTEHSNECWFDGGGLAGTTDQLMLRFVDSFMKYVDYFYENDRVAGGFGWSMFDYNNEVNYTNTNHVFYSGIYDIFRHEKPLAQAYRSQMDIEDSEAIVSIANRETGLGNTSTNTVYVFSNCEEVELFAAGVSQGRIEPNKYRNLPHPVFAFENVAYAGKELKAVGYVNGDPVKEDVQAVTKEAVKLAVKADYDTLTADGTDMTSVTVTALDENGNEVPFAKNRIRVTQKSGTPMTLITEDNAELEGGKIAFFAQSVYGKTGTAEFEVTSDGLASATCEINVRAFEADDLVPESEGTGKVDPVLPMRYTINDSVSGNGLYQFDYQGEGWESGAEKTAYNGDNHWTSTKDDYCEIRFEGETGIQYYGAKAPAHGIVAFSVDGQKEVPVDCYAAERQGCVLLFDSGVLGEGEHVLKVRMTGDKNASATGMYMNADKVVIYRKTDSSPGAWNATYFIENCAYAGQRVVIDGAALLSPGTPVITWPDENDLHYRWYFQPQENGFYIVNANSGLVLTAKNGAITQEKADGSKEQLWNIEPSESGDARYKIQNIGSSFYLAATQERAYGSGYQLTVAEASEADEQRWLLEESDTRIIQAAIGHGTVTPQKKTVSVGDSISMTAVPADGYEITGVRINGEEASKAVYKIDADGVLTLHLRRIHENKTVNIITEEKVTEPDPVKPPFTDIAEDDWFYREVSYVYEHGLMRGKDETHFAPYETLVRAQFAVVLHRIEGEPEAAGGIGFPDVQDGQWYTDAILWAAGKEVGIITGYTDSGLFGTNDPITREQMAVMMYRYADFKDYETGGATSFENYTDAESVSEFAEQAMKWAVGNKIITGKDNATRLDPQGSTSRAECAIIIQRFHERFNK